VGEVVRTSSEHCVAGAATVFTEVAAAVVAAFAASCTGSGAASVEQAAAQSVRARPRGRASLKPFGLKV
jgi:hypothetical protein